MKEKSILLKDFEVKDILYGESKKICREVKQQILVEQTEHYPYAIHSTGFDGLWHTYQTLEELINKHHPYSRVDVLWVKETWREALSETHECYAYKATMTYRCGKKIPEDIHQQRWESSVHMSRAASRLALHVDKIWLEQIEGSWFWTIEFTPEEYCGKP